MSKKYMHYCEKLSSTINFLPDMVKYCCECTLGLGIDVSEINLFSQEKFLKQRTFYINQLKNNKIPQNCVGCVSLREKELDKKCLFSSLFKTQEKSFIRHIIVNHFKQCDCSCIYCTQKGTYKFNKEKYNLLPIVKELYASELIDNEHLKVEFQGGNVSVLNEFNDLMNLFYEHKCRQYTILTNGIKYLEILEKVAQGDTLTFLVISLDSGTKETFKYIKQVDAFEKVLENIKQYNEKTNIKFVLKYIIINGVNDNNEELNAFLNLIKTIKNLHAVVVDIDYRDTFMSESSEPFVIPKHYFDLFETTKQYCSSNDIQLDFSPYVEKILKEGKAYSIISKSS